MDNIFAPLVLMTTLVKVNTAVDCNGKIVNLSANTTPQILMSPNYPDGYFNHELCRWVMQSKQSYEVVKFRFLDYDVQYMANCAADYVDTRDGKHLWSPAIKKFCGTQSSPSSTFSTTSNALLVELKTDRSERGAGFRMEFWTRPKGVTEFTDAEFDLAHKVLYGVFGIIWILFGIATGIIAIIRNNPRLYSKYVMKLKPARSSVMPTSSRPSIASVNANLEIQKRRLSVAGLSINKKKLKNGSVTSLTTPVV